MFGRRFAARTLPVVAVMAVLAGCSSSPPPASSGSLPVALADRSTQAPLIKTENLPGVGHVLADANGFTLYVFEPDSHSTVSCTDACAGSWPPVKVSPGTHPRAGAGVDAKLLGSDPDPAGGQVATYRGWALYGYASDLKPRQANGQALDLNGGPWYVIRPSGDPVIPASQGASGMTMGQPHG